MTTPNPTTPLSPAQGAAPRVTTRIHSPLDFGLTVTGGTFAEQLTAIIEQTRAMAAAGLIGSAALSSAGVALLDAAQDVEMAA